MNPWEIWLWPWIVASALTRPALETVHGPMEANDGDVTLPQVSEPEWASPNHVTIELDAMRVRDFSIARGKRRSTLIVAPFALHEAMQLPPFPRSTNPRAGARPLGVCDPPGEHHRGWQQRQRQDAHRSRPRLATKSGYFACNGNSLDISS